MTSSSTLVETSKFLSFILRHQPEAMGLTLDSEGWVDVDTLLVAANRAGNALTCDLLVEVVATSDKKRFTLSADGRAIRAAQGHSTTSVTMKHVEKVPPATLYHGTATRFLDSILENGLLPQARHHVHLSQDSETAAKVGARHGKLVILEVAAGTMQAQGHRFFQADNGVWLAAAVPPEFLRRTAIS
ncbi:MAG TPA: RNA 2'-phosphotransferase [Moraxellaceae bacterium]|nr:RNA 2'-phosphotransferase [Moraxellaceae bacterium]